jgi:hypothetical protein
MARVQAFEIHELSGCPNVLRRIATEYLRTVGDAFRAFEPITPLLAGLLEASGERTIVDLCSGAGGPLISLAERVSQRLGFSPELVLTDLNPVPGSLSHAQRSASVPVRTELEPVDARAVPERLAGVRTVFDAFHHFKPEDARHILADASSRRVPILVVEATERSLRAVLGMMLFVPPLVVLLTPFIRPFSGWRLFFTYVVPVAVPLILFDGIVSCLRTYTLDELRELTAGLEGGGYAFKIGTKRARGQQLIYLLGTPNALPEWAT